MHLLCHNRMIPLVEWQLFSLLSLITVTWIFHPTFKSNHNTENTVESCIVWREIRLKNGHKCVLHDLQVKNKIYKCVQRFVRDFGFSQMRVPIHTQIPNNLNRCKTVLQMHTSQPEYIFIFYAQIFSLQLHKSDHFRFWKASCEYKV